MPHTVCVCARARGREVKCNGNVLFSSLCLPGGERAGLWRIRLGVVYLGGAQGYLRALALGLLSEAMAINSRVSRDQHLSFSIAQDRWGFYIHGFVRKNSVLQKVGHC